jgi:hypothetical protein
MSRRDAFIPENIDLVGTHRNYQAMIGAAEARLRARYG